MASTCDNFTDYETDFADDYFQNCSFFQSYGMREQDLHTGSAVFAIKSFLLLLILCISTIGNAVVIFIILHYKHMRESGNIFILNMAAADLCGCIFFATTGIIKSTGFNYPAGAFYCQFDSCFKYLFTNVSQVSLIALSLDRMKRILMPLSEYLKVRTTICICVLIWLFSLVLMIPLSEMRHLKTRHWLDISQSWCHESSMDRWYLYLFSAILVWIPAVLMPSIYAIILFRMKAIKHRLSASDSSILSAHEIRIMQMIFVYLITQSIVWTPQQVIWLFRHRPDQIIQQMWPQWEIQSYYVYHLLAVLSCALNPFIYGIANHSFRVAIKQRFPCFNSNPAAPLVHVN